MAGLTDMIEAVRVLEEREDSESTCSWDDDEMSVDGNEASGSDRAPELYSESEVARIKLRFAVGDTVSCTIDKGRADGIVVQRFYREDEWPRGHYAAYQVRLLHSNDYDSDGQRLIYAPRDEDCYVKRAATFSTPEAAIHVDRRVSQERRLIRKLEDSLYSCIDPKKQALYDKVRHQHRMTMDHIIKDLLKGLARSA